MQILSTKLSMTKQKETIKLLYDNLSTFEMNSTKTYIVSTVIDIIITPKLDIPEFFCVVEPLLFDARLYIGDKRVAIPTYVNKEFKVISTDAETEHDMFTLSTVHDYHDLTLEDLIKCNEIYKVLKDVWYSK